MKTILGLAAILMLGLVLSAGIFAQEATDESEKQPEFGPPQEIKDMAIMIGDWDYKGHMRMDPDSSWIDHESTVSYSYVAGGAAIQMIYTGMMMGMEMHGLGLMAYDRELGMWQETWVDNFGGRVSIYTGKETDGKRVVSGKDYMEGLEFYSRMTTYDVADNEFKWMMENSMDGENWYVSMEGVYTRKK